MIGVSERAANDSDGVWEGMAAAAGTQSLMPSIMPALREEIKQCQSAGNAEQGSSSCQLSELRPRHGQKDSIDSIDSIDEFTDLSWMYPYRKAGTWP